MLDLARKKDPGWIIQFAVVEISQVVLSLLDRRHLRRASGRPVDPVRVSGGEAFQPAERRFVLDRGAGPRLLQFPRLWVGSGAAPGGSIH